MKNQVIWKYPLQTIDIQTIDIPKNAMFLSMQVQHRKPCLWYQVDSEEQEMVKTTFEIHGTGNPMQDDELNRDFLGTYQLGEGLLVFHVFEVTK